MPNANVEVVCVIHLFEIERSFTQGLIESQLFSSHPILEAIDWVSDVPVSLDNHYSVAFPWAHSLDKAAI